MKTKVKTTEDDGVKTKKAAIEALEKVEQFFLIAVQTSDEDETKWKSSFMSHGNVMLLADRVEKVLQSDDDFKKAMLVVRMGSMLGLK